MDKLIHYANLDGRLNVFYSTPAAYTAAKHSYNNSWPLKTDDYFPYADNEWSYWTGLPCPLHLPLVTACIMLRNLARIVTQFCMRRDTFNTCST